jgi:predicted nucleic acid-binding protein
MVIHNGYICSLIEDGARNVQDKLNKSRNSTKSLKDIEIMESDELCTYIKKTKERGEFTLIWIAVDKESGEIVDFKVSDRSKATYLKLALTVGRGAMANHKG